MDLILTVVADPQGANMRNHTKVFDNGGGSFGRADDNTWVLPDPERVVSSHHARIQFESGKYFVVDSSTNGTFLNEAASAIERGTKQPLGDGDILGVGDYRLKVTMRVPEIKTELPKGLAPVDFFDDNADRTRMDESGIEKVQSGAGFDHYLDPGSDSGQKEDQWGFLAESQGGVKAPEDNSLLDGFPGQSSEPMGEQVDPLAALGGKDDKSEISWENDDEWWKSGSEGDNAPVDQHVIKVNPQPPHPEEPIPQPTPQPNKIQRKPALEEPNPFQASAALVHGQQQDSSEILDSVAAQQSASDQAAPPPIPVPVKRRQEPAEPVASKPKPTYQRQVPPRPASPPEYDRNQEPAKPKRVPANKHNTQDIGDMRALAESMGLSNISDEGLQELMPEAAAIIHESIARLIELMRARTSIKNELRVSQTMIQLQDNNPLKFSATASDAMAAMFGSTNSSFMSPTESVIDSFDDLSDHQMAVLNGMRSAYEFMLKQFSPKMLEGRLNIKTGVLGKNAKKWEAYEAFFEGLNKDPESAYRRLFGEEFANAYEIQLAELKNSRQMNRRDS